jgi:hypothetical protein
MKRGSKFLIVALSTFAMAGTAVAQGDGGDTGDGTGDATGDGTGDAGTGDAGTGDGTGDAGTGDTGTGDTGGDTGGDMGGDMGADAGAAPGLILDKGKIGIFAVVEVNLSKDFVAKPISINPDIWYGVMPKLEVGVAHSAYGLTGFWSFPGGGVCPTGEENGCPKVYNGPIGILAHYLLVQGGVDLAADAGILIDAIDPFILSAKVGVKGRKMAGKLMIGFAPSVHIGITKRDEGNTKEVLSLPIDVHYMVSPKLAVGLQTGIQGPFDGFGDGYRVPVGLGGVFMLNEKMMAGASFNLLRVAGFEGPGAADLRSLNVFFGFHN